MATLEQISTALDVHGIAHGEIKWKANHHNIAFSDDELVFIKLQRPELTKALAQLELNLSNEYGSELMAEALHRFVIPVGNTTMTVWRWEAMEGFEPATISPDDSRAAARALNVIHNLSKPVSEVGVMVDFDRFSYNIYTRTKMGEQNGASLKHLAILGELGKKYIDGQKFDGTMNLVLVHGDTHVGNVVRRSERKDASWIDFESAKIAPREIDIATLKVNLNLIGGNDVAWGAAEEAFLENGSVDKDLLDRFTIARIVSMTSYILLHPDEYHVFESRIEALEPLLRGGEIPDRLMPTSH